MPAVPEPLDRQRSRSAPTARCTSAPATARASTSPTTARTATRSTRAATRRRASAARRRRRPPRAARCAPRTSARPATRPALDGAILRVDPDTGAALPDNPNVGSSDAQRAPDRRPRPAQPVPDHGPPRHQRALGRRRRLERRGRRSTAIPNPTGARRRTSAGPATRATAARAATTTLNLNLCENLYSTAGAVDAARTSRTTTRARSSPARRCPTGGSSISGLAFYTGGTFPAAYNGALFFADYTPQLHLGRCCAGANGLPDPATSQPFVAGRRRPGRPPDRARTATSTTSTSTAARSAAIRYSDRQPARRPRSATRDADHRRGAADRQLRRHAARATPTATRSPTPGTSTATAQFDDSTAATPTLHVHRRRARHRRPARDRPGGLTTSRRVPIDGRERRRRRRSRRRPRGTTWKVGDTITFSGSATDSAGQRARRRAALTGS